jgi:hypothetical protein
MVDVKGSLRIKLALLMAVGIATVGAVEAFADEGRPATSNDLSGH